MNRTNDIHLNCPYHDKNMSCISSVPLFDGLPEYAKTELISMSDHKTFKKGDVIAQEDQQVSSVLIIRKGRVKTSRIDITGEEYILDIFHDGQSIWHDMFLSDQIYHYSIIALTDVQICEISRDHFMEVIQRHPEAAYSLITMLSSELYEAKEKSILLSIRNPLIRLAGFLLDKDTTCTDHLIQMKLDDIAASIGLRPETISRNLSRLEKENYIKRYGHGKIRVINRAKLLELYKTN